MMLCAWTGLLEARPRAPANKKAESAILKDVLIIAIPSDMGDQAVSPALSRPGESPSSFPLMPLFH
jgi:hypothetical protein